VIAMLLAAGRGERLRPLTQNVPKALVEVHGVSLLERHLLSLSDAGVETAVINLGWLGEQIVERIGSGERYGLNVIYSPEGNNILETGGGIFRALPMLGSEPFIVINSDIYTDMPIPGIDLNGGASGHLVMVPRPAYRNTGDFDLVDGIVRNTDRSELIFAGVAVYRPGFFKDCVPGRFSMVPLMRAAADAGELTGSVYRGEWADVGTPERLAELNRR
jgi:MurNAc alpha-1-phosphate uridylyltransferase